MRAKPHIMRKMKNKKFYNIARAVGSFVLLVGVCVSAALFFHTYYYDLIYVQGPSMYPTLNGDVEEAEGTPKEGAVVDFGIVDPHESAKKHIKRFNIISTYYPDSTDYDLGTNTLRANAKKKIKRVIALPGETFEIKEDKVYILKDGVSTLVPYNFKIVESDAHVKDTDAPITLKENEYWVLGDNRPQSRDCASINTPITYENICGVLVAIEGKGTLHYDSKKGVWDVIKKQYHWPTFY